MLLCLGLCLSEFFIYKYDNYYTLTKNDDDKIQIRLHPLKQVKLLSAIVQIVTLYLGLFFSNTEAELPGMIFSVTVLAVINLGFAIFFYLRMRIEIVNMIISKNYSGKFVTFFLSVFCWIKDIQKYKKEQAAMMLGQTNFQKPLKNNT